MLHYTRPLVAVSVMCVIGPAAPLAAQDSSSTSLRSAASAAAAQITETAPPATLMPPAPPSDHRPPALVPLYLTFGALQVLDLHSTYGAIDRGATEANPVINGLLDNEVGMIAMKAAATTAVVYASERMWKGGRMKAVLFMVAANSAMAWVVQHNYRAAR